MTHVRNVFSATHWVLALVVAYGCIHVASVSLTRLVLDHHTVAELDASAAAHAALAIANLVAAFGLLGHSRAVRVISACMLMVSSLASQAGLLETPIAGGFVIAAGVLALLAQVPIDAIEVAKPRTDRSDGIASVLAGRTITQ